MSARRGSAGDGLSWTGPAIWALAIVPELAFGALAFWIAGRHGPALLAAAINLVVCLRFAMTLRPGQVPLITRYARCDRLGLPPECEGYTRGLTSAWAWLLAGFALLHALAMADLWPMAAVGRWQAIAFTGFFLGEHLFRSWRMPQLGIATPWRTFQAIWRASTRRGEAPHAA
ncbi:hypothetical protein [Roseococcus sp. YIM B11640]|uniref:hypothetical protein n=1 Tax=Roseococcus sp. YIM B11640 TaxID=3133973 RepID=UPI003C7A8806